MKKIFLIIFLALISAGIGAVIGGYLAVIKDLPQIEELKAYRPSNGTKVYADDDRFVAEFNIEKGIFVSYSHFPKWLKQAVTDTEDEQFWTHSGIDFFAMGRALVKDIMARRIKEGGSTITQQLAKVLFLSPEKKLKRKLQEVILAFQIEMNLSKEEILELYLNKIYFGRGAYGIEMASRTYFGKSVDELNLAESAMIAGLIKAPNRYSPYNKFSRAKARQKIVLQRMAKVGHLTTAETKEVLKVPLVLRNTARRQEGHNYFLEALRKHLEDKYGTETLYKGGLQVYATINLDMQTAAKESLKWGLRRFDKRLGWRGPIGHREIDDKINISQKTGLSAGMVRIGKIVSGVVLSVDDKSAEILTGGRVGILSKKDASWAAFVASGPGKAKKNVPFRLDKILKPGDVIYVSFKSFRNEEKDKDTLRLKLEQLPEIEGAIVSIEPSTGYIKTLVGGYDFSLSEFNRAISAKRQPGSAFKPVIYTAAMDRGFTPADMLMDEKIEYSQPETGIWQPGNYSRKYYGPTRLRNALAYSRNIITVKLLDMIGIPSAIKTARQLGVKGELPEDLTLGLGSLSITPLQLTSVFSVFANNGVRVAPTMVRYILDAKGNLVENNVPEGKEAISPETAYLTTSMLEDVVRYGTGRRAKALKRPVAGKTGTTNEHRDAWFLGFTPDLVAGVWVGYDNTQTMGKRATGSSVAAPIWVRYMKEALKDTEPREFPIPEGIVTAIIDAETGLLATPDTPKRTIEFFKKDTVPERYSSAELRFEIGSLR